MNKINLKIQLLNNAQGEPEYSSKEASGLDLKAGIDNKIIIMKNKFLVIPTGIIIEIPSGFEAQVRPRSGLAANNGISVLNTPGTIDSDYRGEIKVILFNHSKENFTINNGDRIAQMVLTPIIKAEFQEVDELPKTFRGKGGFGSTGK